MGTRGLLGFIVAAQRHAAYNHYDSYPTGLGQNIVKFLLRLKEPEDHAKMQRLVREITVGRSFPLLLFKTLNVTKWVDERSKPSPELQRKYSEMGFSYSGISSQRLDDWYFLLHKTQGGAALPAIQSGRLQHMVENVDFLKDGLFCEWAYFIDFENQKLETWSGGAKFAETSFKGLAEQGEGYMENLQNLHYEE